MKKIIFIILATSFLTACNSSDMPLTAERIAHKKIQMEIINIENQNNIDKSILIGKTPFGDNIYATTIKYVCTECKTVKPKLHTLYFTGNVVTKNETVREGKSYKNKVEVFINENPSPEEIIKEADRLKKEIEIEEKKEYLRLKTKFDK